MGLLGFLLSGGLLLLGLPPTHGPSGRSDSSPDSRALSCIPANRPADRADRSAARRTFGSADLGRRRSRLLHRLVGIESCLLLGPLIAAEFILFLLLFRLPFRGIHED